MNGLIYKIGYVLVLSMNLSPLFGLIQNIIVHDVNNYYYVCQHLDTVCFCEHFHSYEVKSTCDIVIIKHNDLYDHTPLHIYHVNDCSYVSLKYYLIDLLK